jgi:hypothetical protein
MFPSPEETLTLTSLALAVKETIQDLNTPKIIRDKLIRFAAELRDKLSLEKALAVDAAEAEAIILAFVSRPQPLDGKIPQSPPLSHETLSELESTAADPG